MTNDNCWRNSERSYTLEIVDHDRYHATYERKLKLKSATCVSVADRSDKLKDDKFIQEHSKSTRTRDAFSLSLSYFYSSHTLLLPYKNKLDGTDEYPRKFSYPRFEGDRFFRPSGWRLELLFPRPHSAKRRLADCNSRKVYPC